MGQAPLKKRLVAPDRDTKNRWVDACCALLGKSLAEPEPAYAYHDDAYYPHDDPYADPYEVSATPSRRLFSMGCVALTCWRCAAAGALERAGPGARGESRR